MRLILILLLAILGGCASNKATSDVVVTSSLASIKEQCTRERATMIQQEWREFEFHHWGEVRNGWRRNFRRWAAMECEHGRTIPQFHPSGMRKDGSIF